MGAVSPSRKISWKDGTYREPSYPRNSECVSNAPGGSRRRCTHQEPWGGGYNRKLRVVSHLGVAFRHLLALVVDSAASRACVARSSALAVRSDGDLAVVHGCRRLGNVDGRRRRFLELLVLDHHGCGGRINAVIALLRRVGGRRCGGRFRVVICLRGRYGSGARATICEFPEEAKNGSRRAGGIRETYIGGYKICASQS